MLEYGKIAISHMVNEEICTNYTIVHLKMGSLLHTKAQYHPKIIITP